jgi:glutamyl/glutaminyl-tRNA synthetase
MNGEYIRLMPQERFNRFAGEALKRDGISVDPFPPEYINAAFVTCKEKVKQFTEVKTFADFYFLERIEIEEVSRKDLTPENARIMQALGAALASAEQFSADALGPIHKKVAADLGIKIGLVVHPTRLACTGRTVGPSLYHLMEVLGKERVLKRIHQFIAQAK